MILTLVWLACAPSPGAPPAVDSGTPPAASDPAMVPCLEVCAAYADCGCEARCTDWCAYYLSDTWADDCRTEIEALIVCGTTHPSPCTWIGEDPLTCEAEIVAFGVCSGNDFLPLPGAPDACTAGG